MTNTNQRALVVTPLTRLYADQPIIESLSPLHNRMRRSKHRPFIGLQRRAVRVVLDVWNVRRPLVEAVRHVLLRELRERARLEAKVLHDLVNPLDLARPDGLEHVVCKCRASVRRGDCSQGEDLEVGRSQATDHVARVQTAHAVRDDVDLLPLRLLRNAFSQLRRSCLDAAAGWDCCDDDFDAVV
jgi:hypothetical protein